MSHPLRSTTVRLVGLVGALSITASGAAAAQTVPTTTIPVSSTTPSAPPTTVVTPTAPTVPTSTPVASTTTTTAQPTAGSPAAGSPAAGSSTTGSSTAEGSTTTTSTTVAGGPPVTGVPDVPTGLGVPTTTVPPGTPTTTPAPVRIGPAIDAVDADLAQLSAITAYGRAERAVPAAQVRQLAAAQGVLTAEAAEAAASARVGAATDRVGAARHGMAELALAAYTGQAYAVPGIGQATAADGTVSSGASSSPAYGQDASVLLGVIVQHTTEAYGSAEAHLERARHLETRAQDKVARARTVLASADAGVASARLAVVDAAHDATVPGAATADAAQLTAAPGSAGGTTSTTTPSTTQDGPSILGPPALTAPELAAWYATTGDKPATTVPIAALAADYLAAGKATGVRGDLAFAQSIIETGYFSFPKGGQLAGSDNNFAGIGACDTCAHGWTFPNAKTGVSAQLELLEAYASPTPVPTPLIGPIGVGGCCSSWSSLARHWASSPTYGVEILTVYARMLAWVIPHRLAAAGLSLPAG